VAPTIAQFVFESQCVTSWGVFRAVTARHSAYGTAYYSSRQLLRSYQQHTTVQLVVPVAWWLGKSCAGHSHWDSVTISGVAVTGWNSCGTGIGPTVGLT